MAIESIIINILLKLYVMVYHTQLAFEIPKLMMCEVLGKKIGNFIDRIYIRIFNFIFNFLSKVLIIFNVFYMKV